MKIKKSLTSEYITTNTMEPELRTADRHYSTTFHP